MSTSRSISGARGCAMSAPRPRPAAVPGSTRWSHPRQRATGGSDPKLPRPSTVIVNPPCPAAPCANHLSPVAGIERAPTTRVSPYHPRQQRQRHPPIGPSSAPRGSWRRQQDAEVSLPLRARSDTLGGSVHVSSVRASGVALRPSDPNSASHSKLAIETTSHIRN